MREAGRARGTRAPTNIGAFVRQGQRGGLGGRPAPRAGRRCGRDTRGPPVRRRTLSRRNGTLNVISRDEATEEGDSFVLRDDQPP